MYVNKGLPHFISFGLNIFYFKENGSGKAKMRHEPYPTQHIYIQIKQSTHSLTHSYHRNYTIMNLTKSSYAKRAES